MNAIPGERSRSIDFINLFAAPVTTLVGVLEESCGIQVHRRVTGDPRFTEPPNLGATSTARPLFIFNFKGLTATLILILKYPLGQFGEVQVKSASRPNPLTHDYRSG